MTNLSGQRDSELAWYSLPDLGSSPSFGELDRNFNSFVFVLYGDIEDILVVVVISLVSRLLVIVIWLCYFLTTYLSLIRKMPSCPWKRQKKKKKKRGRWREMSFQFQLNFLWDFRTATLWRGMSSWTIENRCFSLIMRWHILVVCGG